MGKKQAQSARQERRSEARKAARSDARKPEQKRPYTLTDCMKFGRTANILFVVFIIICLIYYYSIAAKGNYVIPFEIAAYAVEASAFVLFTISVIWMTRLVRARSIMKVMLLLYIVTEVVLMLLEFQFLPWTHYNGLSLGLILTHVIFSGFVSLTLLMLQPENKRVQVIVSITTIIIFAGMFLGLAGYRVYASILLNAFAYIFFYSAMLHQLRLEEVEVDCYGDRARESNFASTMFADTPTMVELPPAPKATVRQRIRRVAESFTDEEHIVLTDKDEKFEYEFGVQEDDDDEYEDYEEYEDDAPDAEGRDGE